jgi:hypothetical protein
MGMLSPGSVWVDSRVPCVAILCTLAEAKPKDFTMIAPLSTRHTSPNVVTSEQSFCIQHLPVTMSPSTLYLPVFHRRPMPWDRYWVTRLPRAIRNKSAPPRNLYLPMEAILSSAAIELLALYPSRHWKPVLKAAATDWMLSPRCVLMPGYRNLE